MMVVWTSQEWSDASLAELSERAEWVFGKDRFWLDDAPHRAVKRIDRRAWSTLVDGPPAGEGFLMEVQMTQRLYSEGYESGDFGFLYLLGMWLERNVPGGRVFYGGDNYEVLFPFGEEGRQELLEHFLVEGHGPYYGGR